jgi:glycosyltransferase involved in cell wall biosynthesis
MSSTSHSEQPREYVVVIPAYNEQSSIVHCLDSIYAASQTMTDHALKKIVVCINGCTDNTETLARNWNKANVSIIYSKPGYVHAINTLFSFAKQNYPELLMVKTDADGYIAKNSLKILFEQLETHSELTIAGGMPIPVQTAGSNPYRRLMSKVFSVRSRSPKAEIAVNDVSDYHHYTAVDPIAGFGKREEKLKIYFHGRLWCARTASILPLLPECVIGDDVYLPGWLIKTHGKKSMRLDYRAEVYYHPNDSLQRHWKVYRRIHEDREIVYGISGFEEYAQACPLKLDWKYIVRSCPPNEILYFLLYHGIVTIENLSYRWVRYNPSHWQYDRKES